MQRKVKEATQWTNVIRIDKPNQYPLLPITPAEVNASNYIDTDTLQMRRYNYRMIAYGKNGNYSVSDVYEVKPYDDGLRGLIRPLKAKLKIQGQSYVANPALAVPGGGNQADIASTNLGAHHLQWVKGAVVSDGRVAEISWQYETKFPSSLVDFSIYKKVNNTTNPNVATAKPNVDPNPFVLIKTIQYSDAARIAMANGKTGYMVYIEALNPEKLIPLIPVVIDPKPGTGNGTSPNLPGIASPFEYKIIANHRDGGWSHEAKAPLVKTQ